MSQKADELAPPSEGHAVHLCDDRDIDLDDAPEHVMKDRDHLVYLVLRVVRNVDAAREGLFPRVIEDQKLEEPSFFTSTRASLISFIIAMVSQLSGGVLSVMVATLSFFS